MSSFTGKHESCKSSILQNRHAENDTHSIVNILVVEGLDQLVHLTTVLPFLSCLPHNTTSEQRVLPEQIHILDQQNLLILLVKLWLENDGILSPHFLHVVKVNFSS